MIDFQFRTEHAKGSDPPYAEAYGEWTVSKPVTREEYERFCDGMDKAKELALQSYREGKEER